MRRIQKWGRRRENPWLLTYGYLILPHLKIGNPVAGSVLTAIDSGACSKLQSLNRALLEEGSPLLGLQLTCLFCARSRS